MKTKLFLTAALSLSLCAASTAQTLPAYLPGYPVFDADGNDYETVIIGDQQWTKRNLLTSHFSNGDSIANVIDGTEWYLLTNNPTPAWCSLSLDAQYDSSRGKLYNWYAVHDPRNICPIGWRTPSEADWDSLILYLDPLAVLDTIGYQSFVAGAGLKDTLNYLWTWGNFGATNATGFSARPAGIRGYYGNFYGGGNGIFLWTNSESSEFHAYFRGFEDFTTNVSRGTTQGIDNKTTGGSVRCVKGAPKIKGFLFNDLNNNCVRDEGEAGIGNTTVTINGANANVQTNSDGYWFLDSLAIGSYSLGINNNSTIDISCNAAFNIFGNESGIFQFAASLADTNSNSDSCNPLPSNLQNGLVGYWPFCGNANDESGNGNDGTVNGATLTEDRFGNTGSSYVFEGNQTIVIPHNETLNLSSNFALSLWYKPVSVVNPAVDLLIKGPNDFIGRPYYLRHHGTSNEFQGLAFRHAAGVFPQATSIEVSSTLPSLNEWHHVIVSINDSLTSFYVDGELKDTTLFSGLQGIQNTEALRIGGGYYQYFGSLDDIGIWNRALSAEEVQQLYTLNACTFTIYDTVTVTETIYDTVSVSVSTTDTLIINTLITAVEPAQENTFLVYPNPASTQITINNGNVAILGGYTMRITNSLGQDVYNQNITQPQVTLDLSTWSGNGLYVLYIVDPQQNIVAVKQIVLQ
jgi:uncharacterized protein (TIGR02145 family)